MADIPESFMQPLEDQPNLSVDVEVDAKEIPVFDFTFPHFVLLCQVRGLHVTLVLFFFFFFFLL
jgi:hypothetical protein